MKLSQGFKFLSGSVMMMMMVMATTAFAQSPKANQNFLRIVWIQPGNKLDEVISSEKRKQDLLPLYESKLLSNTLQSIHEEVKSSPITSLMDALKTAYEHSGAVEDSKVGLVFQFRVSRLATELAQANVGVHVIFSYQSASKKIKEERRILSNQSLVLSSQGFNPQVLVNALTTELNRKQKENDSRDAAHKARLRSDELEKQARDKANGLLNETSEIPSEPSTDLHI